MGAVMRLLKQCHGALLLNAPSSSMPPAASTCHHFSSATHNSSPAKNLPPLDSSHAASLLSYWAAHFPSLPYCAETDAAHSPQHLTVCNPVLPRISSRVTSLCKIPRNNEKLQIRCITRDRFPNHPCATVDSIHSLSSSSEPCYGLFATKHIAKAELLGQYTGAYLHNSTIQDDSYAIYTDSAAEFLVDARLTGNEFRFVNDYRGIGARSNVEVAILRVRPACCDTFAASKPSASHPHHTLPIPIFYATRDIQPGEEILWDYGTQYWSARRHLLPHSIATRILIQEYVREFSVFGIFLLVCAGFLLWDRLGTNHV